MRIEQKIWTRKKRWQTVSASENTFAPNLVLVFGKRELLEKKEYFGEIKNFYPEADILFASTSGEIVDDSVSDESIAVTAIEFEKTKLKFAELKINENLNSFQAGSLLAKELNDEELIHVFLVSDGQNVNGSKLVEGLNDSLPNQVTVTGGLAGDGTGFQKTVVGLNRIPEENIIAAVGFYGKELKIGYGSVGGWDTFGPQRKITRSEGNILYELDGQSALDLYKIYLGDLAEKLPASALHFPLSLQIENEEKSVVRTILSVNEKDKSMIFAGDMPEGSYTRFMMANFDRLIEGASRAAAESMKKIKSRKPQLAILISCVGRKIVLDQRIEEEVEAVREILGKSAKLCGFYSYGEICPFSNSNLCQLHNQTMTITIFSEGE